MTLEEASLESCFQLSSPKPGHSKIAAFRADLVLLSINNKCALKIGTEQLPEYAAKQMEVSFLVLVFDSHELVLKTHFPYYALQSDMFIYTIFIYLSAGYVYTGVQQVSSICPLRTGLQPVSCGGGEQSLYRTSRLLL